MRAFKQFAVVLVGLGTWVTGATRATAEAATPFMSVDFAKFVCDGWNNTILPKALGRSEAGWIDSRGSKGSQPIIMRSGDCQNSQFVQFDMKADGQGNAVCQGVKPYHEGDKYTWKMEPDTEQWIDFADGFGLLDMPKIFTKFEGDTVMATQIVSEFEVFFAMVGYEAMTHNVTWTCEGPDAKSVASAVKDIDREKNKALLKGMPLLLAH